MIKAGLHSLIARPLVFLLPFFIIGLSLGPRLAPWKNLLWPVSVFFALFLLFWTIKKYSHSILLASMVFVCIGSAFSASVYTAPINPKHVYHQRDRPDLIFGGQVAEAPRVTYGRTRLVISAREVLESGGRSEPAVGRIYVTVIGEHSAWSRGDYVRFPAILRAVGGFANPGVFDSQVYWAAQGVWVTGFLKDPRLLVRIETLRAWPSPTILLSRFRNNASRFLEEAMGQPARGLMKAMLLGIRDEIDPEIEEAFRRVGLAHILAISGLHVGFVALISYWLFLNLLLLWPKLGLKYNLPRLSILFSLGPVLLYAGLAGGRPSTVRAAIMVGIFCLAVWLGRTRDPLTALAAAAWAILILQPGAVFSVSFQLSFAAVGAILILAPRISNWPLRQTDIEPGERNFRPALARIRSLAAISLSAFLGTAPIVAFHFNRLPLLTLPANLIITPLLVPLVIPAGLMALILIPIFPWAARIIFLILERLLWMFLAIIEQAASWDWIDLTVVSPGPAFIFGYYALLLSLFLIRPMKKAAAISFLIVIVFLAALFGPAIIRPANPRLAVTFLDVGQGNAAHVSLPDGTQMMVDGGGFSRSSFDTGEGIIAPYLLRKGHTRVDILCLSHAHPDHYGGLTYLARNFHPTEFWSNREFSFSENFQLLLATVREQATRQPGLKELHRPRSFGAASVQTLHPWPGFLSRQSAGRSYVLKNDNSLVLKVRLGKHAFLLPGDLETAGETEIVSRQGSGLKADVLLASHHGGRTSLTKAFLEAVEPKYVVFSIGRHNRFRLPSKDALERVRRVGAKIFRTDQDGAVTFITDGETLEVRTHRKR
ncbi:MAG: DNA internalization-related competence protein ComEC/Rec2 [Deltaproteobacteria bacterium]|nr:DNA internalization-related competence protein ComEC/Rec2 [Deltaproteobacteria bacterium]